MQNGIFVKKTASLAQVAGRAEKSLSKASKASEKIEAGPVMDDASDGPHQLIQLLTVLIVHRARIGHNRPAKTVFGTHQARKGARQIAIMEIVVSIYPPSFGVSIG